ncbi:MAG: nuclear transport factor 2 family protein [Albidovulum sp.]
MHFQVAAQRLLDQMATAYRAGDAAGCAAVFTHDAVLMSPYAPLTRSRAAIEALHRHWLAEGGSDKTMTVLEAEASGDLGWCLVAYSEGDGSDDGKTLAILARQPDGTWLISRCSLSNDVPPLVVE